MTKRTRSGFIFRKCRSVARSRRHLKLFFVITSFSPSNSDQKLPHSRFVVARSPEGIRRLFGCLDEDGEEIEGAGLENRLSHHARCLFIRTTNKQNIIIQCQLNRITTTVPLPHQQSSLVVPVCASTPLRACSFLPYSAIRRSVLRVRVLL